MEYKLPPLPEHPEPRVMAWSELEKRAIQEYGEACAIAALEQQRQIEAQGVPDGWKPTPENINALPKPWRLPSSKRMRKRNDPHTIRNTDHNR